MENTNHLKTKLPTRLYELLQKIGIEDPKYLILKSDTELQNLAPFTRNDLMILKNTVAELILGEKRFVTGLEMHLNAAFNIKKLSFGCPVIDKILDGGIKCKGITEISGESRAGKTQFCLQLSLTVQYPEEAGGLNAGAVFICTEDVFPSKRLQQLFDTFPTAFRSRCKLKNNNIINFADNIYIDHASDAEHLVNIVVKNIPLLMTKKKIGLIVIDSIAAVFRIEPVSPKRSRMMREIGMTLHKLANEHRIAIVCINQVSCNINNRVLIPCLGLTWANLVTTRIQLYNSIDKNEVHNQMSAIRTLRVIFDSSLTPTSIFYEVTEAGVHGIYT